MVEIADCIMPDCTNKRAAVGKRGKNSPVVQEGGDKSKRSSFCRYHLKGKGKPARIEWQTRERDEQKSEG